MLVTSPAGADFLDLRFRGQISGLLHRWEHRGSERPADSSQPHSGTLSPITELLGLSPSCVQGANACVGRGVGYIPRQRAWGRGAGVRALCSRPCTRPSLGSLSISEQKVRTGELAAQPSRQAARHKLFPEPLRCFRQMVQKPWGHLRGLRHRPGGGSEARHPEGPRPAPDGFPAGRAPTGV